MQRAYEQGDVRRKHASCACLVFCCDYCCGTARFRRRPRGRRDRSEEHTSELQSLMRISSAVFCLEKIQTTPPTSPPSSTIPCQNISTNPNRTLLHPTKHAYTT